MKNEHGVTLDRNGYAPSIIPGHDEYQCKLCARNGMADHPERHEMLKREAQRIAMERYGWTVDEFRAIFRNNYLDEDGTT